MSHSAQPFRRLGLALSAIVFGFCCGALLSYGHAQDRGASPSGTPWGSRGTASGPGRAKIPRNVSTSAPDDPGPGRPSATQRPALRTLSGGDPLPPPELAFLREAPKRRAIEHRVRAETLDAMAVRCARQIQHLAPRGADRHVCLAANAARRGLDMALTAGLHRADTAESIEAEAGLFSGPEGASGEPGLAARMRELRALATEVLLPRLEAVECEPLTSTVLLGGMAPTLHLPLDARRPVGGRVAFFVRVPSTSPVVWVDGRPEGLAESDGWAVVTGPARSVTLCAADPTAGECAPSHRAVPGMGDAYDLRDELVTEAGVLLSPPPASPRQ